MKTRTFTALKNKSVFPKHIQFSLPHHLEASEPPEARGLARDQVQMMVSFIKNNRIVHTKFRNIIDFLEPGDLLVVNTSGTMNAAVKAQRENGSLLHLHISTRLPQNRFIVELRLPQRNSSGPFYQGKVGEKLTLPSGAIATLLSPYKKAIKGKKIRLWQASLELPQDLPVYLEKHGFPICYNYLKQNWPSSYYQTVYATEMGSAEMPSAGRAFTYELITKMIAKGIQIAPLVLHTGVSSLESHEAPYEEFYRVPEQTAHLVNIAHRQKKRVIATGTTVIRALESATKANGTTQAKEGWTQLIIGKNRGLRAVNAMLTGFHEPQASHLAILEALANREHIQMAYQEALYRKYLWHEFGDLHLILS